MKEERSTKGLRRNVRGADEYKGREEKGNGGKPPFELMAPF